MSCLLIIFGSISSLIVFKAGVRYRQVQAHDSLKLLAKELNFEFIENSIDASSQIRSSNLPGLSLPGGRFSKEKVSGKSNNLSVL